MQWTRCDLFGRSQVFFAFVLSLQPEDYLPLSLFLYIFIQFVLSNPTNLEHRANFLLLFVCVIPKSFSPTT